jgi:hypothetical protein
MIIVVVVSGIVVLALLAPRYGAESRPDFRPPAEVPDADTRG